MKVLLLLIIAAGIGVIAWMGQKHGTPTDTLAMGERAAARPSADERPVVRVESASSGGYRCDGRTKCSQMTSCAEATWFLKNCPGTTMDGNHDGVPCEMQWCRR